MAVHRMWWVKLSQTILDKFATIDDPVGIRVACKPLPSRLSPDRGIEMRTPMTRKFAAFVFGCGLFICLET